MSPVLPLDMPAAQSEGRASFHQFVRYAKPRRAGASVRRRGSMAQGRALETLGHAVEYLVDSRLFEREAVNQRDEQEAVQILMRLSRAVFEECPAVVTLRERIKRWFGEHIARSSDLQNH